MTTFPMEQLRTDCEAGARGLNAFRTLFGRIQTLEGQFAEADREIEELRIKLGIATADPGPDHPSGEALRAADEERQRAANEVLALARKYTGAFGLALEELERRIRNPVAP